MSYTREINNMILKAIINLLTIDQLARPFWTADWEDEIEVE